MRRLTAAFLLLLTACASAPSTPAPTVPEWELIPAGIAGALCKRLQMDGVGTIGAEIAIVKITQPIVNGQVLGSLGRPRRGRPTHVVHRALPVATVSGGAGGCAWKPIDALDPARQHDSMVVELSAPVANPTKNEAGIAARVSLGGTHPNWYWIELIPAGGAWSVGRIFPLAL